MSRWLRRLEQYLFAPAAPTLLGRCRVAFYLWVSAFYWPVAITWGSQDISDFADVGSIFWHPLPLFDLLHLPLLPHPWLDYLYLGWKVALAFACVGLFTRLSMWLSFVPALYLLGLPLNFGTVNHATSGLVMGLGIMAFSRAGDAVSIDAWWRSRTGRSHPLPSGEYRWPIRFVWILLATIYACAGIGKWASSGFSYLDPDVMASFLRQRALASYQPPLTDWGWGLVDYPWLLSGMAAWALLFEIGFFTTLWSRRARIVLVPGMFLMHIGIAMLLGPQFFQLMALYVFWVPWARELPEAR